MVPDDVGALQDAIHATDLRAIPVLVGAILFGVFSLLLVLSTYLLLKRGAHMGGSLVMLCATWSMYAASASYLILDFASFLSTAHNPEARTDTPLAAVKWQSIVLTALLGITFILSDAIVLWRATIFWRGKFFVKVISIVLFVVIFVFGVADLATDRSNLNPIAGVEATRLIPRAKVDTLGIVSMLTSLIANLWAAGLMAVKAWYFRKVMISTGSMSLLFWKFLRLLLVCSVIYCIFWLTFLGIAVYPTNSDATITLGFAFSNAIVQLTGIYPTIIVVIVNLEYVQTTAQDNIGLQRAGVLASNDSESMQLTRISWRRSSFPQIDDLAAPESSPGPETDAIPDDNKGLASEATTRSRSPSTIHGPTAY